MFSLFLPLYPFLVPRVFIFFYFFFSLFFYLLHCVSTSLLAIIRDDDFPRSHFSSFFQSQRIIYTMPRLSIDSYGSMHFLFIFLCTFSSHSERETFFMLETFVYNQYVFYLFNNTNKFCCNIYLSKPILSNRFWLFILQTEARVWEIGQREDRDAEALRYGKALCKFLFMSFLSTRSSFVISFFSRVGSDPNPKALGQQFSFLIAEISRIS